MTALPRSNAFRASLTAVRRGHLTDDSGQPDRLTAAIDASTRKRQPLTAAIDASTRKRQPLTAAIDASTLTPKSYRLWAILRRACPFLLTLRVNLRIVFSQLEALRRHKAKESVSLHTPAAKPKKPARTDETLSGEAMRLDANKRAS